MKDRGVEADYIVTATTRPKRDYEIDGVNYHFVDKSLFMEMKARGEFLEYAQVYGNWYGVPREQVRQAVNKGRDAVIKVDIQGAKTIKNNMPEACFVFVPPPDLDDLPSRLKQRNTESEQDLELRLKTAGSEFDNLPMFDYMVYNPSGRVDAAVDDMLAIIKAEKLRVQPRDLSC